MRVALLLVTCECGRLFLWRGGRDCSGRIGFGNGDGSSSSSIAVVFLCQLLDWSGALAGEFVERLALLGVDGAGCRGASGLAYALVGGGGCGGREDACFFFGGGEGVVVVVGEV